MLTPCYIPDASQAGAVRPPVAGWYPRAYGATSGYFGLKCPAVGPMVDWTMPGSDGTNGQALTTNGSGMLAWSTFSTDLSPAVVLAPTASSRNVVQPTGVAVVPFTLKTIAGQTADAQQWQNSSGTALAKIDNAGIATFAAARVGATGNSPANEKLTVQNTTTTVMRTAGFLNVNLDGTYIGFTGSTNNFRGLGTNTNFLIDDGSTPRPLAIGSPNGSVPAVLTFGTDGTFAITDGSHFVLGTGTGSKIGTSASQKLSFFGAAPVVQQTKAAHNNWAVLADVVSALVNLGLLDQN